MKYESNIYKSLQELQSDFEGDIFIDEATRLIYATDASAYREKPLAVTRPKNDADIKKLIHFAHKTQTSLIPRAAGTSLAGQVVGNGIVVDTSRYMTDILELNTEEHWVRVQPGVILDELNLYLKPYGLFFGPETSTSNRCMLAGMLGNNSCGSHSLIYGSTREHTLEVKTILSDGSDCIFKSLSDSEFNSKLTLQSLEGDIYRKINDILTNPQNRDNIEREFPDFEIERRNTGYAIDLLLRMKPFTQNGNDFNFCSLLAGSEGTLAFTSEIKLNLVPLPPLHKALVCVHCESVRQSLEANLTALEFAPTSVELMDKPILDLTKENIEQNKNRFFVQGDPAAILVVEFSEDNIDKVNDKIANMEKAMRDKGFGYHFGIVTGNDMKKVWDLRKAGLGILNNMVGDAKPVPVIEDTAVNPKVIPDFIEEIDKMLANFGKSCVHYGHISTGELHLRPILNLKDKHDVELFHSIALETANLVKKYKGSLSGEHGDGRLRGEFLPIMLGNENYDILKEIKFCFDKDNIFNPNKIIDTPSMNSMLRFDSKIAQKEIETVFDFSKDMGIQRAAEKCNGTAACRKTEVTGGTMCPSYMATRDESNSTRARANLLREFLTRSDKKNPFDHKELYKVMDLCLSCKACKSECPSSVDVAKLKAEFLQHYYDSNGSSFRAKLIANLPYINNLAMILPSFANFIFKTGWIKKPFMTMIGFEPNRSMPLYYKTTLERWFRKHKNKENQKRKVFIFNDEFTRFNDTEVGIKAILLLTKLGYEIEIPQHAISGRTLLSKGFLRKAKRIANKNVSLLSKIVTNENPLIGIEPSTILAFRDEYPELVDETLRQNAKELAKNVFTIEEFICKEFENHNIAQDLFTSKSEEILYHGHCQVKAIASTSQAIKMMQIPKNYKVTEIKSGCCGMAGAFGYEKEHYETSMKVGELVLFPSIRNASKDTIISASGTSCRHQIKDGTGIIAKHPVEILYEALI